MQFRYLSIPADRYDDVIALLQRNFYVDEPLNKAIGPIRSYARKNANARALMAEGHSVMALDDDNQVRNNNISASHTVLIVKSSDQQIAGVLLCGISRPGDCERALAQIAGIVDDDSVRIVRLLCEESIKLDLFARLQCDRIFEVRIARFVPKATEAGVPEGARGRRTVHEERSDRHLCAERAAEHGVRGVQ